MSRCRVGVVAASTLPPAEVVAFARLVEELGFAEAWFGEDYFWVAGIAAATAALGATETLPVGVGVVSAMVRHPAVLAMEIATIDAIHPGRLKPAIGLGNPGWLEQMGRVPRSQLTAVKETVTAVAALLGGGTVTREGEEWSFAGVRLEYSARVPLYMGAVGPRMHRLAGEIADATIAGVLSSPVYLRAVRELVGGGHPLSTYVIYGVDEDRERARQALREPIAFYLATLGGQSLITDALGYGEELLDMHTRGGSDPAALIARELPDAWLDTLGVAGDPAECAAKLAALLDAGAETVILNVVPAQTTEAQLRLTAAEVLPRLARVPA